MITLFLPKEDMTDYSIKVFKWYWNTLPMELMEKLKDDSDDPLTLDVTMVPDIELHKTTVKAQCIANVLIKISIHGPNIVECQDSNFQQDKCANQEITADDILLCNLDLSEISVNVKTFVFRWDDKMCHYAFYLIAKWFEPQILPTENISDWLIAHCDIVSKNNYLIITFINVDGKTIPTYANLNAIQPPNLTGVMGNIEDGQLIGFLGCISSPGIISSLLLTRDKLLEAKVALKSLQTAITGVGASLVSNVTTIQTSLSNLTNTVNTIQTNVSTLSTSVTDINTKLNLINNELHLW